MLLTIALHCVGPKMSAADYVALHCVGPNMSAHAASNMGIYLRQRVLLWRSCLAPGITGSGRGLPSLESVYCDHVIH